MEKLTKIVNTMLQEYLVELRQGSENEGIEYKLIADETSHNYQIIALGWKGLDRFYNLLFHIEIIGNKIWIQEDKMEYSIAERLLEKGISKSQIVLAYYPEFHRQYTGYALA
jgi:XisI protein